MTSLCSIDIDLAQEIGKYYGDPLGFVRFAFPWGEKDGPLENEQGPDENQTQFLLDLGQAVRSRKFDGSTPVMPIRMAESSGHGTGKTVLGAWLASWILCTRPHSIGTVTAGTKTQLKTRNLAIRYWLGLCIAGHWFVIGAERIHHKDHPDTWKLVGPDVQGGKRAVLRRPACPPVDKLVPIRRSQSGSGRDLAGGLRRSHRW